VFPLACREIRSWERRAATIPDPILRQLAINALRTERGNLEGATAFATFVPRHRRTTVARAAIAFQAAYDYVDAVSEHERDGRADNTARLHRALEVAVGHGSSKSDYYAFSAYRYDGGYLRALVNRCRCDLTRLPAFPIAAQQLKRAAHRISAYQHFQHRNSVADDCGFAQWAMRQTSPRVELRWWEVAAAAGSSLAILALMATAARADVSDDRVRVIEGAYFPWIGSLHTLLDSLVDRQEDIATGQRSLLDRYRSEDEAVARLQLLAGNAAGHARSLPGRDCHMLILAAMASFYLSARADDPYVRLARCRILSTLGHDAAPAIIVLRARRVASSITKRTQIDAQRH
jgi:tetraprenyl-beta-curcumene synthase